MYKRNDRELVDIGIKNINEDFTQEIKDRMKIIILVEHSKSSAKPYTFLKYANKKFEKRGDKYIVALAQEEFIDVVNTSPKDVIDILRRDMEKHYKAFKEKYPDAIMEKAYTFNYALDYSEKSKKAELFSVALVRISNTFVKSQISPIVPLTEDQYLKIIGKKNDEEEGKLLNDIINERVMGIELFGIVGYLTNGKIKTGNLYMENLLDIFPEYENVIGTRGKLLKYPKFRSRLKDYLKSLKPVG
ncbi:MAG: hypothetical protein J6A15_07815 [Clostridia bacterium]|nr:hypothetical protein [Clostridia bacterium]